MNWSGPRLVSWLYIYNHIYIYIYIYRERERERENPGKYIIETISQVLREQDCVVLCPKI